MFPDIGSVLHIRDALWRYKAGGSASVMVGSGFSRNAEPVSPAARPMPNWSDMAVALCGKLYPHDDIRRKNALQEASGTSGFLRLAQEYQTAYGVASLNDRIAGLVPDLDYRPGDMHKRLLRLPWADVFSTNWDSLLERTCLDVFDRNYEIVRTISDIPFAISPRIVKLHGSFPSHQPYIFTEEEYRTYPAKFGPFVNLVQQSMMETTFCLVGFSGDDPNFLHWSGWVRDNLGSNAPRIYLVGWLALSIHRRRTLEARHVMPVDLSELPQARRWPPEQRHHHAIEWFIAALELGKPSGVTHWPSPLSLPAPPPSYLDPLPPSGEVSTLAEPNVPGFSEPEATRLAALREVTTVWRHNRRLYPGWLIAPRSTREALRHRLGQWWHSFSLLPKLSPWDRLCALSEFAWLMERSLLPLEARHEEAAFEALEGIDRAAGTIAGQQPPEGADWADAMKCAQTLAVALCRNARYAGNRVRFERAIGVLGPARANDRNVENAITYEECQWDLSHGNLAGLLKRLDGWAPAPTETVWGLRKAGLLAEMGEDARACALVEATLASTRQAARRDIDDIAALSLEGWALYLALAYSTVGWRGSVSLSGDQPEPFERWRSLRPIDCDSFAEYDTLRNQLKSNGSEVRSLTVSRGFDLDRISVTHHLANEPSPTLVAAYQMSMLGELTGIPPVASHHVLFKDGFSNAAKFLAEVEPWLAAGLALRIYPEDKLVDEVFSRAGIARLSEIFVNEIRDAAKRRIQFGLGLIAAGDRDGSSIVGAALEILSRVSVRLSPVDLIVLVREFASHYCTQPFRRSPVLGMPLTNLLGRALEAMPRRNIESLLPLLFGLPLPHEPPAVFDERRFRDPGEFLPSWFEGPLVEEGERAPEWGSVIPRLINAAKTGDAVNRAAAIVRLFKLLDFRIVDEDEQRRFAAALWTRSQRDNFGLPAHTKLRPWVLLRMPEESPLQARDALLGYIAERSSRGDGGLNERLATIGKTLKQMDRNGLVIDVPAEVQSSLILMIEEWSSRENDNRPEFSRALDRRDEVELDAIAALPVILHHVTTTEGIIDKIWEKLEAIDCAQNDQVRAFALYPALARICPARRTNLINRLRRALVSDREREALLAVRALFEWLVDCQRAPDQPPLDLDDLVREVGYAIAARRVAILRPALDLARWVFSDGPDRLRTEIAKDVEHGLAALFEEASYERSNQVFDVPEMRAACIRLATAMAETSFGNSESVTTWLHSAKDDPLPEVRNAKFH
jgi:SIR2-like domain